MSSSKSRSKEGKKKVMLLKTRDNQVFEIKEAAAIQSVTLKNMIDEGCASGVIPLPTIDSKTLIQILVYLDKHSQPSSEKQELSHFDEHLFDANSISTDLIFDIILAADFLDIKGLLDLSCKYIADMIKDKSPQYVRKLFNIVNDFSPEEEAKVRQENEWAFQATADPHD